MRYSICLFCAFSLSFTSTMYTAKAKKKNPRLSDMNEYNLFSLISPEQTVFPIQNHPLNTNHSSDAKTEKWQKIKFSLSLRATLGYNICFIPLCSRVGWPWRVMVYNFYFILLVLHKFSFSLSLSLSPALHTRSNFSSSSSDIFSNERKTKKR
jgi:hypothetical protein